MDDMRRCHAFDIDVASGFGSHREKACQEPVLTLGMQGMMVPSKIQLLSHHPFLSISVH